MCWHSAWTKTLLIHSANVLKQTINVTCKVLTDHTAWLLQPTACTSKGFQMYNSVTVQSSRITRKHFLRKTYCPISIKVTGSLTEIYLISYGKHRFLTLWNVQRGVCEEIFRSSCSLLSWNFNHLIDCDDRRLLSEESVVLVSFWGSTTFLILQL